MKKKLLYSLFFIILFFFTNKVFCDEIDFDGGKLYSSMSKTFNELENNIFVADLIGDSKIKDQLNALSGTNCVSEDITNIEFQKIVNGKINYLYDKISDNCKGKNGSIGLKLQKNLIETISNLNEKLRKDAHSKANKLIKMSESGIYADGIEENAPFDLIKDLEEIDEIIFEKTKEYDYEADNNFDLRDLLKDKIENSENPIEIISPQENNSNSGGNNYLNSTENNEKLDENNPNVILCKLEGNCETKSDLEDFLCKKLGNCSENLGDNYENIYSNDICKSDNSGLKNTTKKILELNIKKNLKQNKNSLNSKNNSQENNKKNNSGNKNSNSPSKNNFQDFGNEGSYYMSLNPPESGYEKPDDSPLFPCNDTFCIELNFNTYNHNLLGGWIRTYPSIEFLLKRSNNHLKPFINSNLDQTKMTNENFELGIINLDLANTFHMAIHVEFKPVPILEINNKKNKTKNYELEDIYRKYYNAYSLDYDMRNDLAEFNGIEENKLATINSVFISPQASQAKLLTRRKKQNEALYKIDLFEKTLEQDLKTSIIGDLEEDFREIEVFAKAINYYTTRLDAILDLILETSQDNGKT